MQNDCMPTVNVFAVGSAVLLDGGISARITAIFIRDNERVTYEVVWWNDRERNEEVLEPWEIHPDSENARTLRVNPVL